MKHAYHTLPDLALVADVRSAAIFVPRAAGVLGRKRIT